MKAYFGQKWSKILYQVKCWLPIYTGSTLVRTIKQTQHKCYSV